MLGYQLGLNHNSTTWDSKLTTALTSACVNKLATSIPCGFIAAGHRVDLFALRAVLLALLPPVVFVPFGAGLRCCLNSPGRVSALPSPVRGETPVGNYSQLHLLPDSSDIQPMEERHLPTASLSSPA